MDKVCSTPVRSRRSGADSRRDRRGVRERQQERNRAPWSRVRESFAPRERLCSDNRREYGPGARLTRERAQTDHGDMARVIGNIGPVRSAVRVSVVGGVHVPSIFARRRHGSPAIEVMSDAARIDEGPERKSTEEDDARERMQGCTGASCERRGVQDFCIPHVPAFSPASCPSPRPTSDPGERASRLVRSPFHGTGILRAVRVCRAGAEG